MTKKSSYTCGEYREEMILLSLKKHLTRPGLSDEEKQNLKVEIQKLESEMGLE